MQSGIHHSDDNNAKEVTESSQLATLFSTSNRLARRRYAGRSTGLLANNNPRYKQIFRIFATFALIRAFLQVAPLANAATNEEQNPAQPVNAVVEWNRTLLAIVRTPGAQPATIHSTRNFAILHAAIYDAVNAIDGSHTPYLIRLTWVSPTASQEAAASAAAHEVLVALYPSFKATLDTQFQQSLAQISGGDKAAGVSVGQTVA